MLEEVNSCKKVYTVIVFPKPCTEGMSCDDFKTITESDLSEGEIPLIVVDMMNQHRTACGYHASNDYLHQSGLAGNYATLQDKQRALDLIGKLLGC